MTFGEKLQKLRKEHGLSQEQLAAQITVSRQALSKWELGSAIPDTENVLQISKLFGVSTDYLLNDDYLSDDDVLAVRMKCEMVSKGCQNKIRIITGSCIACVALMGMLIIGILSSVHPAIVSEDSRIYTGLIGYLKCNNLEWLFLLCIIALVVGSITIWYPKLCEIWERKYGTI